MGNSQIRPVKPQQDQLEVQRCMMKLCSWCSYCLGLGGCGWASKQCMGRLAADFSGVFLHSLNNQEWMSFYWF